MSCQYPLYFDGSKFKYCDLPTLVEETYCRIHKEHAENPRRTDEEFMRTWVKVEALNKKLLARAPR